MSAVGELRGDPRSRRAVTTPEGLTLQLRLAPTGDRVFAFFVDLVFMIAGAALVLAPTLGLADGMGSPLVALGLVLWFVVWNFYFVAFEIRWHGATPGKRRFGLRVVDRRGGALTPNAVVVRNLMRNLEFFMPLQVMVTPSVLWTDAPITGIVVALLWFLVLGAFPLFNRANLRIGDLVAGTMVVQVPPATLLEDLSAASEVEAPACGFTPEQLDVYGIYELQVLEELLRKPAWEAEETCAKVAAKIKARIRWPEDAGEVAPRRFLMDFYAAQRQRLEQTMLLGRRRERKRARTKR